MMTDEAHVIRAELESARSEFHQIMERLTDDDLRRPSANPRWTNGQIVWHIVLGFRIAVILVPLADFFGRLPPILSKWFAGLLNWATPAFNAVNHIGARGGASMESRETTLRRLDRAVDGLVRRCKTGEGRLRRGMYYPDRWDPRSFSEHMTVAMILRYPIAHMHHHRSQILGPSGGATTSPGSATPRNGRQIQ